MRLLLAYPGNPELGDNTRGKSRRFPAIGLPVIAAVTPPGWDIELTNEEQGEAINFDGGYDLVGLSSMTSQAPRAYTIADEFRRRGVTVVHGGSHPTVCPEEALEHGDVVVAGEGERSWPELIADFVAGKPLRRVYEYVLRPDEPWYVPPRRSLLDMKRIYPVATLVATRGCPFTCGFCSVSSVFGHGYRHRPVDVVVEEVRALRDAGHKHFIFLDDNIIGSADWAREFFVKMAPLGVHWGGQAHLGCARDPELVRLARQSGLVALFIGIESISRAALVGARKGFNDITRYREWVNVMHDNGICIIAGIIFGFDEDDPSVFARTVEVLDKLDVAVGNFSPLIPLPGTDIHRRLTAERRIFDLNWAHYEGSHVVFRPAQMTPEQLDDGSDWAAYTYFSPSRVIRRFGSNWRNPVFYWLAASAYMYKERTQHGKGRALPISRDARRELLDSFGLC